jgi:hypothetical protein
MDVKGYTLNHLRYMYGGDDTQYYHSIALIICRVQNKQLRAH